MSRPKKSSDSLAEARLRLNSIASIDPNLDLGGGVNVEAYRQIVNETTVALDNYNTKLGEVDTAHNVYLALEKKMRDFSERMLSGVAGRYGKDSNEYEKAGGKRKSERKYVKHKEANPTTK